MSAQDHLPESTVLGYPDVALIGSARSGTSSLAARLTQHPRIDGGAVKEPDFFSRYLDRGVEWYDSLFDPRRPDLLRLDASMSYSTSRYPGSLDALAHAAPAARVVYAVRDPLARAVSHFRLLSKYFTIEDQQSFGSAIAANPVYLGASDYHRWIAEIDDHWGVQQRLIIPFGVTTRGNDAPAAVFDFLGLEPFDFEVSSDDAHRNNVVEFRSPWLKTARRKLVKSRAYPLVRRTVGADRMRKLRSAVTRQADGLSIGDALASCTAEQVREIDELVARSRTAVTQALVEQDRRLGLEWADVWRASLTTDGAK